MSAILSCECLNGVDQSCSRKASSNKKSERHALAATEPASEHKPGSGHQSQRTPGLLADVIHQRIKSRRNVLRSVAPFHVSLGVALVEGYAESCRSALAAT